MPLGQYLGARSVREGTGVLKCVECSPLMRILLIVHGFPPEAIGGTGVYTHDPRTGIRVVAIRMTCSSSLARRIHRGRITSTARRPGRHSRCRGSTTLSDGLRSLEESYANPALLAVAADDSRRGAGRRRAHPAPDLPSTGLPRALRARGTPVVMTLNDYWLLCHRGQLFDLDAGGATVRAEGRARCIPASARRERARDGPCGTGRSSLPVRRRPPRAVRSVAELARLGPQERRSERRVRVDQMREAVAPVDLFLAPSETIADAFATFGIAEGRLVRCGQGIDGSALDPSSWTRHSPPARLRGIAAAVEGAARAVGSRCTASSRDRHAGHPWSRHFLSWRRQLQGHLAPLLAQPFVRQHGAVPHATIPGHFAALDALVVPVRLDRERTVRDQGGVRFGVAGRRI